MVKKYPQRMKNKTYLQNPKITISPETKEQLDRLKVYENETYDDMIQILFYVPYSMGLQKEWIIRNKRYDNEGILIEDKKKKCCKCKKKATRKFKYVNAIYYTYMCDECYSKEVCSYERYDQNRSY